MPCAPGALVVSQVPYAVIVDEATVTIELMRQRVRAPRRFVSFVVRPWSIAVLIAFPDGPEDRYVLWGWGTPGRKQLVAVLRDAHLV